MGSIRAAVGARVHLHDVGLRVSRFHHHVFGVDQDHVPILEHAGVSYGEAGVAGADGDAVVGGRLQRVQLVFQQFDLVAVQFEIELVPRPIQPQPRKQRRVARVDHLDHVADHPRLWGGVGVSCFWSFVNWHVSSLSITSLRGLLTERHASMTFSVFDEAISNFQAALHVNAVVNLHFLR